MGDAGTDAAGVSPVTKPFIVGIGGTTAATSSTQSALEVALAAAAERGARVRLYDGPTLARLPHYAPGAAAGCADAQRLVADVRQADGLILASPGYHGSISGLVKNGIDYLEETARDARVYLDGVPIGLIVTAYGWQATGSTLNTLRSIVHALRGWPTPLGATIKAQPGLFENGRCTDPGADFQLRTVGHQVLDFAQLRRSRPEALATATETD